MGLLDIGQLAARDVPFDRFPRPLEDELLYSVLARYRQAMGGIATHGLLEDAFGLVGRRRINTLLPPRLGALVERLPSGSTTVDELIDGHTAFPYLAPLLLPIAHGDLREHLESGWPYGVRGLASSLRRTKTSQHELAFCPDCVAADVENEGIAGWRRSHQLPGVFVCSRHATPLRTTGVKVGSVVELVCCPTDPSAGVLLDCPLTGDDALELAGLTAKLVFGLADLKTFDEIRGRVEGYLAPDGAAKSSKARLERLEADLVRRFGAAALETLLGARADAVPLSRLLTKHAARLAWEPLSFCLLTLLSDSKPARSL